MLVVLVTLAALVPAGAKAGSYDVYSCRNAAGSATAADGWTGTSNEAGGGYVRNQCGSSEGRLAAFLSTNPIGTNQRAIWQFDAPLNTRIAAYEIFRNASSTKAPNGSKGYVFYEDELALDQQHVADICVAGGDPACTKLGDPERPFADENRLLRTGRAAQHLYATLECFSFSFCGDTGLPSGFAIYRARISLQDESEPTISELGGDIRGSGPVTGNVAVSASAQDLGGGIERVELLVDGVATSSATLEGKQPTCQRPFVAVVPCPLAARVELPLNTSGLTDGVHHADVSVIDAGGNENRSASVTFVAKNASVPVVPNGSSADRSARLLVSFRGRRFRTVGFRRRALASGRLVTSVGQPIVGAHVGVYARVQQAGARWRGVSILRTGVRGGFRYRPTTGASRAFRFVYRAYSSDRRPTAARTLQLRVRAGIRLSVRPRFLRNGRTATFRVRLLEGPGRKGTLVSMQVLRPQKTTFSTRAVGRNGIATVRHRFRYTYRPTTYLFRAVVQPQRGYPYLGAASGVVRLRVRP